MNTNIDPTTGVHFGVIPPHAIGTRWYESSEPHYPAACPECGSWEIHEQEDNPSFLFCDSCHAVIPDGDQFSAEPTHSLYSGEGYSLSQRTDDHDVFVEKSPFCTFAEPCSPCAPNAGYLPQASMQGAILTYCLGHDWFEEGKAPYPVFLVTTGQEVLDKDTCQQYGTVPLY